MRSAAFGVLVLLLGACGGGGSGGGSTACPQTSTVTISSTGVSPTTVCVAPGGTVTFNNTDAVAHDIEATGACTPLNLGSIAPAGTKTTTALTIAATCGFHDATNASAAFAGTIDVSMTTGGSGSGGGY
jgi:plastocyanin